MMAFKPLQVAVEKQEMYPERQRWMNAGENQIIVYQPDETVRLDVCLEK